MKESLKIRELQRQITDKQAEIEFLNNVVGVIMNEQNLLDMEIDMYTIRGTEAKRVLADLKAELADTI